MAEQTFCIDFGSGFTKVGLRRHPTATTVLVNDHGIDTTDFCYHSVVVIDRSGPKPVVEYGKKAAGRAPANGIEIHANWKQWLFLTPSGDEPGANSVEAFLRTDELAKLAARHGVTATQIGHLRQLVSSARELLAGAGVQPVTRDAQRQQFAASLAVYYFTWLRQEVLKECERLPHAGVKYADIPTRVSVPAFAHGSNVTTHPGCKFLTTALVKAGWSLHPENPVVSEPVANTVGVLTNGLNATKKNKVDLGSMFNKGPVITVGANAKYYAPYRAIVVDVGGYTTDFAVLTLRQDGLLDADPERAFDAQQHSVPLGVSDLDKRVLSVLPPEKAAWLSKRSADELDGFRVTLYTEGKPVRSGVIGTVGAPGTEGDAVRDQLSQFAAAVGAEVRQFLTAIGTGGTNELVLTGGGVSIPAVRDAILTAAAADGREFVKIHGPDIQKKHTGKPVHKLDSRIARGGGAIGGSSLFFEPALA